MGKQPGNSPVKRITCIGRNNDYLEIELIDGNIVLKKARMQHRTLEERALEYGGRIGPYEEYTWGEPVGREKWQV